MNPAVTVARKSNSKQVLDAVAQLKKKQVYVGIPAADAQSRNAALRTLAANTPGIVAKANLMRAAKQINNAEKLWIFSKGSPLRGIPARPVLEPSIVAPGNKEAIGAELGAAAKAVLNNDPSTATARLKRAGIAGQRAAQGWFVDPRNGWAANAPSTIKAKGSDRPGIDTAAMRAAITHFVENG